MAKYSKDKSKKVKSRSERPLKTEDTRDTRGIEVDSPVGPMGIDDLVMADTRGNTGTPGDPRGDTGTPGDPRGGTSMPVTDPYRGAPSSATQGVSKIEIAKQDHHHHGRLPEKRIIEEKENPVFNTLSCPCSTKAIKLENDIIACERNNFGEITIINAIPVHNHLVSGLKPKIRDKWRCVDVKCNEGEFKWKSLYIVSVVESIDNNINTSLLDSKISTSNCYIPESDIIYGEYFGGQYDPQRLHEYPEILKEYGFDDSTDIDIDNPITMIGDLPVFETKKQAFHYSVAKTEGPFYSGRSVTEYYNKDVAGFVPGKYTTEEKLITSVIINGKSYLKMAEDFSEKNPHASAAHNPTVGANGGVIKISIAGVNKPTFNLSIKDSSGYSVLKERIKNQSSNNYTLNQEIPSLPRGKNSEKFTIEISPIGESQYDIKDIGPTPGVLKVNIYQYARPTFTLSPSAPNLASVDNYATVGSGTVSVTGDALSSVTSADRSISYLPWVHTTTITRSSGSKNLYVSKIPKIKEVTSNGKIIKKNIVENNGGHELLVVVDGSSDGATVSNTGDVGVGMRVKGIITRTKEVINSIDLDTDKEPCEEEVDWIYTNKFDIINSPNNIFEGMTVSGNDYENNSFRTVLTSVVQNGAYSCITLEDKYVLDKGTQLTFTYRAQTEVVNVEQTGNGELIKLESPVKFDKNTVLDFTNGNEVYINGQITHTQTGGNSLVITTTIDEIKFGHEDITFNLNVEDFVTVTPPARDQKVIVGKDTPRLINFTEGDTSDNAQSMTVNIIRNPSNGALASLSKGGSLTYPNLSYYTPNEHFTGEDKIRFTLSDGVETSEEKTIFITIK